ncbi:MAG TPA: hypothetical protein PK504_08915 [Ferruginibacter sp.]|nr:hypothetical protein [Ferruginibacter sp.]HRE64209.1 hypothetical protein [Ferruginibacter sp.]
MYPSFRSIKVSPSYRHVNGRLKEAGIVKLIFALSIAFLLQLIYPVNIKRIDAGLVGITVSNVGSAVLLAKPNMFPDEFYTINGLAQLQNKLSVCIAHHPLLS